MKHVQSFVPSKRHKEKNFIPDFLHILTALVDYSRLSSVELAKFKHTLTNKFHSFFSIHFLLATCCGTRCSKSSRSEIKTSERRVVANVLGRSLVNGTKESGKRTINNQGTNEGSRRVIVNCGTSGTSRATKSVHESEREERRKTRTEKNAKIRRNIPPVGPRRRRTDRKDVKLERISLSLSLYLSISFNVSINKPEKQRNGETGGIGGRSFRSKVYRVLKHSVAFIYPWQS